MDSHKMTLPTDWRGVALERGENLGVAERALAMHVEALETCRLERDEAREVAMGLLAHLEALWEVLGGVARSLEFQQKEVTQSANRFYPWLKEQATIDEEEEETVS
jgi:hypothetical protein